ncbi:lysoplasmalogenase family protein [Streptomyces sp. NPDC088733]|uniref:lysoplasmalogenase family protein n=1 Tax=Streptomyces sp. NPDC088733 TaxID=3365880 RepID=UPI0038288491
MQAGDSSRRAPRAARAALVVFAAVCAVHLVATALPSQGAGVVEDVTKALLMPALAAWAALRGGPRVLVAALLLGWAGDMLLQFGGDTAFLAGMGCFAAGHVCYLTLLARRGAFSVPARTRWAAAGYTLVWLAAITVLWSGLPPALRVPVAVYSLLLTAVAAGGAALGTPAAAAGGALFLLSDTLIATRLAGLPQPPAAGFWIMLTYLAAQFLLAAGLYGGTSPLLRTARTASVCAPP